MTNIFILSLSLMTNSQQAVIGQTNGKALIAAQETVVRRTVTVEDVLVSSRTTTNAVAIAFAPPVANISTNPPRPINTNSPAFKRRLEREQRMKATNAPPVQQTK